MFHRKPCKGIRTAKKQNKGFSLVEVLVSMLVLAIIIAPILGNISRASQANSKSRKMQDASILGQNIMEGLKSQDSFEEVAKQMIYKDNGVNFQLFSLDNLSSVITKQLEYDPSTLKFSPVATPCVTRTLNLATGDYDYTLNENSSRKYQFQASNITYNGNKYCALITYDGSPYSKADPSDPDDNYYNDEDMPVLPSVSDKSNAVITAKYQDEWASSTLKVLYNTYFNSTMIGTNTVTNDDIANDMIKKFTIDINYDGTKGKYIVKAKFTYTLTTLIPYDSGFTRHYEDVFYKQEFDQLENVYLFFSPNLKKKADEMEINNNLTGDAADITVYLVEQDPGEDATYENLMNQYWLTVDLNEAEPPRDPLTSQYIYHTTIRTNLGSTINGFDGKSRIIYSGISVDKLNQDVLIDRENDKTRIYNIKVDLYYEPESGTEMFKNSDHIMTFTSSKGE